MATVRSGAIVVHVERRVFPHADRREPVAAELGGENLPHHERDVLGGGHALAEEGIRIEIGVIKALHHHFRHEPLQLREIDDHPRTLVDGALHGHVERVVVAVGHREAAEDALALGGGPRRHPIAVTCGKRKAPRAARVPAHAATAVTKRAATARRSKPSTRCRPASLICALSPAFCKRVSIAIASSSGARGLTSSPVRLSSTTSGTAAARHATTGSPAAIASRNTRPKPSCTVGRQKQCAPTYSTANACREASPRNVTVSPTPSCACSARNRAYSGPFPTMRMRTSGIRARRCTAAWRRST